MKKEKSCGAIIYDYIQNKLSILLVKHNEGHYSFPKGHMEKDETEEETALREVKEETNLDIKIDNNYRYVTTYSPKENVIKDVVFFLGTPLTKDIVPQISEIALVNWYNEEEALKTITFEDDKKVLRQAIFDIKNKKR